MANLANAANVANNAASAGNPTNVADTANVASAANVANAVFRQVAVPPRRDAAVVLWPALFATNSLGLKASGKGVWRAAARPENAFQVIEGPRRPPLTDREENRPAFPQLRWRRSLSLAGLGRLAGGMAYAGVAQADQLRPASGANSGSASANSRSSKANVEKYRCGPGLFFTDPPGRRGQERLADGRVGLVAWLRRGRGGEYCSSGRWGPARPGGAPGRAGQPA